MLAEQTGAPEVPRHEGIGRRCVPCLRHQAGPGTQPVGRFVVGHAAVLLGQEGVSYNPAPGGYLDYLNGKLGNIEAGDGPKFRGRGMKQLTGRENYSKYWVYRGWLDKSTFQGPWWNPARPQRAAAIPDPQRLSTSEYNAIDAGGWYWEAGARPNHFRSINSAIVEGDISSVAIERVTRAINGGINGLTERQTQTVRIYPILNDEATS